jgi:uncharacterized membrane protein (UPF0127 family)
MSVTINDQTFESEIMSTPEELAKGMMGRDSLNGCMVFKMGKGHHSFWMKGTKIPLDIIYVLNNHISRIHSDCQPCDDECNQRYTGIGDHVIEFPSGTCTNWKVGDRVKIYLGSPINPINR